MPLLPPIIAVALLLPWVPIAQAETRRETAQTIYARYAPMFGYWCLNAEHRYAHERPVPDRIDDRHRRTKTCERFTAIYSERLKRFAAAAAEADDDDGVFDLIQFVGQACIDMQRIGIGRARAEGACPLADRPEKDMGEKIEEVFGPYALQNEYRNFKLLGRRYLLKKFAPGSWPEALTDYLESHGYRCRADQSQSTTQYVCSADYSELIYEMFHASMIGASLPSVWCQVGADGLLQDITVERFDEGHAVFGPYPE